MESERERLSRLYEEMGDEHLHDLAQEPENLTDDARMALAAEMRRRGFTPQPSRTELLDNTTVVISTEEERQSGFGAAIPGVVPAGASAVEQALEPGGEERQGMARLLSFYDGHELTRACNALEDADVEFAIEEIAGDALSGLAPHFEIWVDADEQELARSVLRQKMGLFPLAEIEGDGDLDENDGVVAVFESRPEAEQVRSMLAEDGFQARIEQESDEQAFEVVVDPGEQERALAAVAARLNVQ